MNKNQRGFSAVEALMAIVIVGLIAAVGWLVYDRQKNSTEPQVEKSTSSQSGDQKIYQPEIPAGWVKKLDDKTGIQFATPTIWADGVTVTKFGLHENIGIGYGAPVSVRFAEQTQTWQTFDNDTNNNPTIVRKNSMVVVSSVKVENKYLTATYSTGHVFAAQNRILIVHDKEVYQISLPETCSDSDCGQKTAFAHEEVKADVSKFIKTISFK